MIDVLANKRPARLPIYEHLVHPTFMERVLDTKFADLIKGDFAEKQEFFTQYCRFFKEMTYDTVSFEVTISAILPDHGALYGGRPGPIQTRADFEAYPWEEIPALYWQDAAPKFSALSHQSS